MAVHALYTLITLYMYWGNPRWLWRARGRGWMEFQFHGLLYLTVPHLFAGWLSL